ncbi:MAG: hypothetical protein HXY25_08435 [Alphaproteobacteria bacterium]|nr:hypothetical protein [Alphaproteobacteria bacterium]
MTRYLFATAAGIAAMLLTAGGPLSAQETLTEAEAERQGALSTRDVIDDVLTGAPKAVIDALGGRLYEVGTETVMLTDASREREIVVLWRYPKNFSGKTPLVIISHGGYGSDRGYSAYPHLGTAYAQIGFVALNINHLPSANEDLHRFDRPTDVTFVINSLVRQRWPNASGPDVLAPPAGFEGEIDLDRIGHTGHSFGAYTAHALGGAVLAPTMGVTTFRDPRIYAIVPISPQGGYRFGNYDNGPADNSWTAITIPSYLMAGELENPTWRREPFDRYPTRGDKFYTMGGGQNHGGMGGRGTDEVRRTLAANTALFFHVYLRDGEGRCEIGRLAPLPGWTIERRLDPSAGPGCR